jgi:hypothetical protein
MNDKQRHLKRKYLLAKQLPIKVLEIIRSIPYTSISKNQIKKKSQTILITESGEYIQGFKHNTVTFPTVNPVCVYFDMALRNLEYLNKNRSEVLAIARKNESIDDTMSSFFYYFGTASIFASQLFCAIECLINLKVSKESKYETQNNSSLKTGDQIIWVKAKEKIEFVIPQLTNKHDFNNLFPKNLAIIKSLVDFRNECIHPKKDIEYAMNNYENLFVNCLTFNYSAAIDATKNFINYYSDEQIIEECLCYLNHSK